MAVVVYDGTLPQRLRAYDKSGGAEGAEPTDLANDPVMRDQDPGEPAPPDDRIGNEASTRRASGSQQRTGASEGLAQHRPPVDGPFSVTDSFL